MKHDVMMSFSKNDSELCLKIKDYLERNGLTCWKAPESIPPGSDYSIEVPTAIAESAVFLLLLSKAAQESKWVIKELINAVNKEKIIIPFRIDGCALDDKFSFHLSNVQIIDCSYNLEASLEKLVEEIKASIRGERRQKNPDSYSSAHTTQANRFLELLNKTLESLNEFDANRDFIHMNILISGMREVINRFAEAPAKARGKIAGVPTVLSTYINYLPTYYNNLPNSQMQLNSAINSIRTMLFFAIGEVS